MISFITIILFVIACKGSNLQSKEYEKGSNHNIALYKIEKIELYSFTFLIEVSKNNSVYKILSKYNPISDKFCAQKKLEIGKSYYLKLDRYYPYGISSNAELSGIFYNNSVIPLKVGDILYTTNDLDGVCLRRDSIVTKY